ncbi:hypothetical protein SPBR_03714 [Sporothrix brasiliensis 5110]|uniref:Required for respiratory growth protein 9, mitochondrial n=1 Tax=Sporothrix brasiliensis 5110 TaxID=1398154 RepID=A0A0C2J6V5_9PEZI|nr:uncharacterized protein SPBR_03714 [Sporothrix brasiliensis 5110]KIH94695.1 hypothetical protein SPBR_03714 [Sporothrix brasiliensis 5110]
MFVRSLVGSVPAAVATRATTTRVPTAAVRHWRLLTTTACRPSVSPFQSTTATRTFHMSRKLLSNAQWAEKVEATSSDIGSASEEHINTAVERHASETEAHTATSAPPRNNNVQSLQAVIDGAETEHVSATTSPLRASQQASDIRPGKNMRKRIRRQQEAARLAAEAAAAVAGAAEGSVDPAEAAKLVQKLKPKKEKKEKKEKKSKLEKIMEEKEAKRQAKKDIRRKRRALEKAAASGAASRAATQTAQATPPKPKTKVKSAAPTGSNDGMPAKPSPDTAESKTKPRPLPKHPEPWQIQKQALREKFPGGWNPRKKLSPDALEGIRALHRKFPQVYTTAALAGHFKVSPEAIRRILKSKWQATPEEEEDRQMRWFERGKQVWSRWAELGRKPPKRWQAEGILREPSSWSGGRRRLLNRNPILSRRQILRQTRQNRQNFQASLSEEGIYGKESVPSADVMQRAIDSSEDVDAPSRSVPLTPEHEKTLRKATRSQSPGRQARLRRSSKDDKDLTDE